MEDDTGKWLWLVKLRAMEKVKHLIWLIFHGCSSRNTLRFRRSLTDNKVCPRCQLAIEDTWLCVRDCRRAWEGGYACNQRDNPDLVATASLLILIWPGRRIWPGGRIGAGGLIRSSAELLAIAGGLELAWDREYRKIICHSDTNNVIRLLSAD
ncbi:hypothetical protein NC651_035015 [Populus alba x Populus x berolinensis]|nr:hypothetical protein NC651_035015 [Populus alba x Populus x berolinensis]